MAVLCTIDLCHEDDEMEAVKAEAEEERQRVPCRSTMRLTDEQARQWDTIRYDFEAMRGAEQYSIEKAKVEIASHKKELMRQLQTKDVILEALKGKEANLRSLMKYREHLDQTEAEMLYMGEEDRAKQIKGTRMWVDKHRRGLEDITSKNGEDSGRSYAMTQALYQERHQMLEQKAAELDSRAAKLDIDTQALLRGQEQYQKDSEQVRAELTQVNKRVAHIAKQLQETARMTAAFEKEKRDFKQVKLNHDSILRRDLDAMQNQKAARLALDTEMEAVAVVTHQMREHLRKVSLPPIMCGDLNEGGPVYQFRRRLHDRIGDVQADLPRDLLRKYGIAMELCLESLIRADHIITQQSTTPSKKICSV